MSFDDVFVPSNLIKQDNTVLIAIGVGNVNVTQINEIASDPDEEFASTVENFNQLRFITNNIAQRIRLCEVQFSFKTSL